MKNNKYNEYLQLIEAANEMDEEEGKKTLKKLYAKLYAKYGDDPDVEQLYNRRRWIYLD